MAGFDSKKFVGLIVDYYKSRMPEIADRFKEILKREFGSLTGEVPYEWIAKGLDDIIVIEPVFDGTSVYCEIGWNYPEETAEAARILVALHGNHERQPYIAVKPGEATWQHDLTDPRFYNPDKDVLGDRPIPQFDRYGQDAFDNAIIQFEPIKNDMMKQIEDEIPLASFVNQCTTL